jgi:hypothetical protein
LPSKDFGEDVSFLLYLVPVVVSIIYGAVEWAVVSATSTMSETAYLVVSKSPYLFLISLVSICLAVILEVRSANAPERNGIVEANTQRLQILAVIVLVISFLASISAGGYNLIIAISLFVAGRYAIIYAFFLIGFSVLLSPKEVLGNLRVASIPDVLGLLFVVASPVLFYLGIKVHLDFAVSALGGLIVGIIGFVLLFSEGTLFTKKQGTQVVQKQPASSNIPTTKPTPTS